MRYGEKLSYFIRGGIADKTILSKISGKTLDQTIKTLTSALSKGDKVQLVGFENLKI
jgi:nucleoid DNA-binding protein